MNAKKHKEHEDEKNKYKLCVTLDRLTRCNEKIEQQKKRSQQQQQQNFYIDYNRDGGNLMIVTRSTRKSTEDKGYDCTHPDVTLHASYSEETQACEKCAKRKKEKDDDFQVPTSQSVDAYFDDQLAKSFDVII